MGDSRKAIADDEDGYDELCKIYNETPRELYGMHYRWIEKFHQKTTKLTFPQYEKVELEKQRKQRIIELQKEIQEKKAEIKKLGKK